MGFWFINQVFVQLMLKSRYKIIHFPGFRVYNLF